MYTNPTTGEYDGIAWAMVDTGGSWSGEIVWWHNSTGNMFGPGVVRRLGPTRTIGNRYYHITSPF